MRRRVRKGGGEALTGARAGRVLSREIHARAAGTPGCRRCGARRKATPARRHRETRMDPARSETPRMHGNTSRGNREIPRSPAARWRWQAASGSPRTHADDERPREVGQPRSTDEAAEQRRSDRRRRRWREGGWPREIRREHNAPRTQSRAGVPSALERIRQVAATGQEAAVHRAAAPRLRRRPPAGGVLRAEARRGRRASTARRGSTTGRHLEANLQDLSERLKRGAYRAKPVRRSVHPEGGRAADGRWASPRWRTRSSSVPSSRC